jgi:hypothetical protein
MVYNFLGCMDFAGILGAPSSAVDRGCTIGVDEHFEVS